MGDIAIIKLTIAITVGIVFALLVIVTGMAVEEMHEDYYMQIAGIGNDEEEE